MCSVHLMLTQCTYWSLSLGAIHNSAVPSVQVANVTGVSPVLSANAVPGGAASASAAASPRKTLLNTPLGPVPNMPNGPSRPKPLYTHPMKNSNYNNQPPWVLAPWYWEEKRKDWILSNLGSCEVYLKLMKLHQTNEVNVMSSHWAQSLSILLLSLYCSSKWIQCRETPPSFLC